MAGRHITDAERRLGGGRAREQLAGPGVRAGARV